MGGALEICHEECSRLELKVANLQAENKQLKKEIGDLRAAAVRKVLMKGKSFTGKCQGYSEE